MKNVIIGLLVLSSVAAFTSENKKISCNVIITESEKVVHSSSIQGDSLKDTEFTYAGRKLSLMLWVANKNAASGDIAGSVIGKDLFKAIVTPIDFDELSISNKIALNSQYGIEMNAMATAVDGLLSLHCKSE